MIFRSFAILLLLTVLLFGETRSGMDRPQDSSAPESSETKSEAAEDSEESSGNSPLHYLAWPFAHIVQPALNILVYPFSAPVHYAVKNDIVETAVDAITFGKNRNIFIYPTFNLKPGSQTLVGFAYRHRHMILDRDYFVLSGSLFANSDMELTTRYTKRNVFGTEFFAGGRLNILMDRDASLAVPRSLTLDDSDESFSYADSSYSLQFRIGRPLPILPNMDFQFTFSFDWMRFDYPDEKDTILTLHPYFNPNDRGLYQDFFQVPLKLTLTYDNLDAPYVPTRGSRISLSWSYTNVGKYRGENIKERSNEFDHDYQAFDLVFQHYFYLGQDSTKYSLSAAEARINRKFYTDFSWDETLRLWRPENIRNTLLNRRVLAMQFRLRQMWEMEDGGAPFTAFSTANTRYPLRGYSRTYSDYAIKGISFEYRWPIDRLVDGVVFDEFVMYGRTWHSISAEKLLNSWGFGIRVRKPDMYFFRLQVGFHGFEGIVFTCTIAPEFR